ncbi:3D-(3,5/4)-trihydroxycyclohexane-1,2-dione acylhydrolase (decyclizing) [Amycolatopsis alkalitolerans]|uniref:3D-(3,5/4)-trihydroxycyclohexane-1,2-dione acylhydrolase (Decyclizing) n=1 Tax=Amycolatopsis alkalitolerans TaxID=2547244 RepID=A0A5C4LU73_9PSEU|nr:3D-(3,5/4)-trihydroxycyclohexane-1,2-dione acylhydrolase (decyclizing) [Amycolatopsis alkalitolerans]TNC22244.1 3D-(3,5/4)-trihydroxycyclohexane-1,2-dione acylhydrolase (decyclizing) [Amycolatopsis alkalitolerans]
MSIRLTTGQAIVRYLMNQRVEFDGISDRFFAGMWGIFGHGNIGGVAEALQEAGPSFPYYLGRNEQAMVHSAVAFAKLKSRRQAFACLSSIGPGATNMVTGAATATVNRLPVLLLSGDAFSERLQDPVLQQVGCEHAGDVTANDAFRSVVRFWDRITRPEQLISTLPEVMRTLVSPADTGAVFLALPQDIQTYAFDFPDQMFEPRVWPISRQRADRRQINRAAGWVRDSKRPLIVAGGGVRYSEAFDVLRNFAERTGIPVAETHAGKGSLNYDHPLSLGGAGVAGTRAANLIAESADLVIGVGTRYTDFTTASKTAFQNSDVRFVNVNVFEQDAYKHAAVPLVGDARVVLLDLDQQLGGYETSQAYRDEVQRLNREWDAEVERLYNLGKDPISQGEIIGSVEASAEPRDVVVTSAGSLPGDLLKLWRCRDPLSYQVEYGYSVMGYEIAGGVGAKLADPAREVYVMVGDGSFLMMNSEIATAVQEGLKLIIVVIDNRGFSSVGRVSEQVGSEGFGCHYRARTESGWYSGESLDVDFEALCRGLGAGAVTVKTRADLDAALCSARAATTTQCIVIATDWHERVPGYASCWWDMATPEVAAIPAVRAARETYEKEKSRERYLMVPGHPHWGADD